MPPGLDIGQRNEIADVVQAGQAAINERINAHKQAADRLDAEASKVLARQQAIEARLKQIDALLATQQAFGAANEKCASKRPLEAAVQCMQVEWDRASDNGLYVPAPGVIMRTPEQAIEEFKKSGPPTPLIRPKGGGREPPPPTQ